MPHSINSQRSSLSVNDPRYVYRDQDQSANAMVDETAEQDYEENKEDLNAPEPFYGSSYSSDSGSNRNSLNDTERHSRRRDDHDFAGLKQRASVSIASNGGPPLSDLPQCEGKKKDKFKRFVRNLLPEYFFTHWNRNDMKPVIRSWMSTWISLILITIPTTEVYIGQSCYLMPVICCILPSGMLSVVQQVIISVYLMAAACFAWMVMIITYKICADIRGNLTKEEAILQIIDAGLCSSSLDPSQLSLCVKQAIFSGFFINKSCSIVTAFGMLFAYSFLGYVRQTNPPLTPAVLIGVIFTTISGTYGNFYPYFDGLTVPLFIIKPLGFISCINIALSWLLFPRTSNSTYLVNLIKEFSIVQKISIFHTDFIRTVPPSSDEWDSRKEIKEMIGNARKMFPRLDMEAGMLKKELVYTRVNADNCLALGHAMKTLLNALTGLPFVYDNINDYKSIILEDNMSDLHLKRRKSSIHQVTSIVEKANSDEYAPVGEFDQHYSMAEIMKKEKRKLRNKRLLNAEGEISDTDPFEKTSDLKDLDELLKVTASSASDVQDCCSEAIEIIYEWLIEVTKFRVQTLFIPGLRSKRKIRQKELALKVTEMRKKLSIVVDEYKNSKRLEMYQHFDTSPLSEPSEILTTRQLQMNYILQGNLYGFYLMEFARGIDSALEILNTIDVEFPKPKFFHPFMHGYKSSKIKTEAKFTEDNDGNNEYLNESNPEVIPGMNKKQSHNRNPDALPSSKWYYHAGSWLYWLYHSVVLNGDVQFAIKAAIFTVLTAFPAFFQSSAHFFYRHRLVWVVIITYMGISEYAGTSIYSFIVKVICTFIACVLGMVAWYISAGNGHGNFYGFSAVGLVCSFFLMYYRIFSVYSTPIPNIIVCVTFILVLSLSWVDDTFPNINSLGDGWQVAWIRFVSTLAGVFVGTFASFFPKPITGKKTIRMTLSRTVRETGNVHCDVSQFAIQRIRFPQTQVYFREDITSKNLTALFKKLIMTGSMIKLMAYEPPLTGPWPAAAYKELANTQTELLELYRHLYSLLKRFEDPEFWITKCLDQFGWKDPVFMADFFADIYMSSGALATGHPLPQITPTNLLAKHLYKFGAVALPFENNHHHINHNHHHNHSQDRNSAEIEGQSMAGIESNMSHNKMDLQLLKTYDGGLYITGIILINCIYERLDRLLLCVKQLVGEEFENDRYYLDDEEEFFEESRLI